jgi:ubiquinone/menaquinone biosynthesis C-methylase UbiE
LGHSGRELARLERQGALFAQATEDVLRSAGLKPGMRVLDVGCGVGDVSLLAARIVGHEGSVRGIDRSAEALEMARQRAFAHGVSWVSFENGDINAIPAEQLFDAVTGRFILLYFADPVAVLTNLMRLVRPGGILAFLEMDISAARVEPELPLFEQCASWITGVYRRVAIEPDMGSKLASSFFAAGLAPSLLGTSRVEEGPDAAAYEYVAETVRSLLPRILEFGLATAEEVDVDTLADRLRDAAVAGHHRFTLPRLVGSWSRTHA